MDILGGGLNVAPPSRIEAGRYEFIQGSLHDLGCLPVLHNVAQGLSADAIPTDWGTMREGSGRNHALFRLLGRAAHHCDDLSQLLDYARTQNEQLGEPMQDAEVVKVAQSVWKMTCEGRNRFGQHGAWLPLQVSRKLAGYPNTYTLYGVLRAENGPTSIFPIANAMAPKLGIGRKSFAHARRHLLEERLVEQVCPDTQHYPALYRWPKPEQERKGQGVR
jgi:Primase C terminal 1 (PriCT-1)